MRVPAGVAVVDQVRLGAPVYLARLPSGPIVVLEGTAAIVWRAATGSDRTDVVERVAEASGVLASAIRDEVAAFVTDLVARGYLERVE